MPGNCLERRDRPLRLLALLAALLVLAACSPDDGGDRGLGNVTVFAASSLTESFTELGRTLEADRPGTEVTFNFASSSELAVQIIEGAPVDVFASADLAQMDVVAREGLAGDPRTFAANRLVVLTPADNPAAIERVEDLAREGMKIVLAAPEVPAGNYAREALDRLGLLEGVEPNIVSNEEDVKAVVNKVALGEADAGIAYVTDITEEVEDRVDAIEFPEEASVAVTYPIAVLSDAPNPDGARAFFELVTSDRGRRVLKDHGFGAP